MVVEQRDLYYLISINSLPVKNNQATINARLAVAPNLVKVIGHIVLLEVLIKLRDYRWRRRYLIKCCIYKIFH